MSLPWKAIRRRIYTVNGGHIVAETWETGQKDSAAIAEYDAEFIVKACNAYDAHRERISELERRLVELEWVAHNRPIGPHAFIPRWADAPSHCVACSLPQRDPIHAAPRSAGGDEMTPQRCPHCAELERELSIQSDSAKAYHRDWEREAKMVAELQRALEEGRQEGQRILIMLHDGRKLLQIALARAKEAEKDAARWHWAEPILSGESGEIADQRTIELGKGLMQSKSVAEIIDAALATAQPSEG